MAEQVHDRDLRPVARGGDRQPPTRRLSREVRRPDHALGALEVGRDLGATEDVVAKRDDVGAGGQQAVGELRRDPDAVGDVLAVQDAEVDVKLLAQAEQPLLDGTPPGTADDIGDEEKSQGSASVAAGWTSIVTWFPASCV
jgi:hypothetical protein